MVDMAEVDHLDMQAVVDEPRFVLVVQLTWLQMPDLNADD